MLISRKTKDLYTIVSIVAIDDNNNPINKGNQTPD
jgi:hypothetical protein